MQDLFESRFKFIVETHPSLLASNISFCPEALLPFTKEEILAESGHEFDKFVIKQFQLFQAATNQARRNIWLGNFCEQLIHTVAVSSSSTSSSSLSRLLNFIPYLRDFIYC